MDKVCFRVAVIAIIKYVFYLHVLKYIRAKCVFVCVYMRVCMCFSFNFSIMFVYSHVMLCPPS